MKLLSYGPEPYASANSAIPAYEIFNTWLLYNRKFRKSSFFLKIAEIFINKNKYLCLITYFFEPCIASVSSMLICDVWGMGFHVTFIKSARYIETVPIISNNGHMKLYHSFFIQLNFFILLFPQRKMNIASHIATQ